MPVVSYVGSNTMPFVEKDDSTLADTNSPLSEPFNIKMNKDSSAASGSSSAGSSAPSEFLSNCRDVTYFVSKVSHDSRQKSKFRPSFCVLSVVDVLVQYG